MSPVSDRISHRYQAPGLKLGTAIGHTTISRAAQHHDGDGAIRLAVLDLQIRHRREQSGCSGEASGHHAGRGICHECPVREANDEDPRAIRQPAYNQGVYHPSEETNVVDLLFADARHWPIRHRAAIAPSALNALRVDHDESFSVGNRFVSPVAAITGGASQTV